MNTMDYENNNYEGNKNEKNNSSSRAKGAAKAVVSLALAACLAGSFGMNIYQARQAAAQNRKVNKFIDNQLERQAKEEEKENTYEEDGYKVGNQYEIRSTTHISDAYKSGDDSQLDDKDKKTLRMAKKILKKVIKDDMNNYEKERAVYRWMFKNISHGSGHTVALPGSQSGSYTPFDVLTGRTAVCVGYATTFRMFMNMLGMECHVVHNDYHSWDLVQLEPDGWYHVDVYSDVSGKSEFVNFNMTDEVAKSSHDWDDSALPEANAVKYSYAVQAGKEIDSIYSVPEKIKEAMDKKKGSLYFKFKQPVDDKSLSVADFLVEQMNTALMSMPGFENYGISGRWYTDENDKYILGIAIMNYGDTGNEQMFDPESEEGKKIMEAISKAFGVDSGVLGNTGGGEELYAKERYMDTVTTDEAAVNAVPVG